MSGADLTNPFFIFICLMTLLLVLFLYEVVRTPPELTGPTEQPVLNLPEPAPPAPAAPPLEPSPPPARRQQAPVFPVAGGGQSENGGYSARHASAYVPVVSRPKVSGRPPWDPAPEPPDLDGPPR